MTARESADARGERVQRALEGRRLFWFGIRGEDAEPLLGLPEFSGSFSIAAPLHGASIKTEWNTTLESLTGSRVDLDRYDLDDDVSSEAQEFRSRLARAVSSRCVLITYRPAAFVSALSFAMGETLTLAGQFKDRQRAFEHKPWVETSLRGYGVQTLAWTYVPDSRAGDVKRLLNGKPVVLRVSRASGGVGIVEAASPEDIDRSWPRQPDAFVAVTPYLQGAVPLNFSGCVFRDGSIRLHPPSVQLIGIPRCTALRFGYCGNDFGAARSLDDATLESLDTLGLSVGRWLFDERYFGAFGVDALVHDGRVYFLEVNPRFQGSSRLSASIAGDLEAPDLYVDHLSACLGITPEGCGLSLLEWAREQPPVSHVVVHNTQSRSLRPRTEETISELPYGVALTQWPRGVEVLPGGVLCRLVVDRPITDTGSSIDPAIADLIESVRGVYVPAADATDVGVVAG